MFIGKYNQPRVRRCAESCLLAVFYRLEDRKELVYLPMELFPHVVHYPIW